MITTMNQNMQNMQAAQAMGMAVNGNGNDESGENEVRIMKDSDVTSDRCYTIEDIMIILGICKPTAYNLLKNNDFSYVKIGRGYRISKKSFDKWLDSLS